MSRFSNLACKGPVTCSLLHPSNSAIQNGHCKCKALSCTTSLSPELIFVHPLRLPFLLEAFPGVPLTPGIQYCYFCHSVDFSHGTFETKEYFKHLHIPSTFILASKIGIPHMSRWMREWKFHDNCRILRNEYSFTRLGHWRAVSYTFLILCWISWSSLSLKRWRWSTTT